VTPVGSRRSVSRWVGWVGFLALLALHLDFWRPQRAVLYFGWVPEELLWRLGWMLLAWVYLLFVTSFLWGDDPEDAA
jgi:hypothetical protein